MWYAKASAWSAAASTGTLEGTVWAASAAMLVATGAEWNVTASVSSIACDIGLLQAPSRLQRHCVGY